jgi:hypothetical protein
MNKEEAKKIIHKHQFAFASMPDEVIEAVSYLIEEEQEPMLDKARAEMLEEMLSHSGTGEEVIQAYVDGLKKGVDILDKYKAESENT